MFMSSRDELPLSDASTTTRRVLTPPSESRIGGSDDAGSSGRKRKRDGNAMEVEDLLKEPFVVKPYPSTLFVKPRSLQPLLLLPRSHLPLSSLDITSTASSLPRSRLFETHVKILELEERMGSQPMVLIARLDDGRTLYAVEREERGLYVLLQLGSWVNLQQLRAAAVVSKPDLSKASEKQLEPGVIPPAIPLITPGVSSYNKKKRLAIEAIQSMVKRPSSGPLTEAQPATTHVEPAQDSQSTEQLDKGPPLEESDITAQPTAGEIFENVRNQYFEALYLSKASLAYFAKGPLSRARAAFHLDYDSALDMREHIAFLESLILSTTLIDKKYRDGVPGCVASIDIHDNSADDAKQEAEKTKRRKSTKKMKPGKNGLYPLEDVLIRRWWAGHDDEIESGAPGTSREDITKKRIGQLRIRETQLQMIIILETLALQPLVSASGDTGDSLPTSLPTKDSEGGKAKPAKSKMPESLSTLIDVHIDRLCIWQSIVLESVKAPTNGLTTQNDSSATSPMHTDNFLRDFCVEVIVPFFAARLPDRCAAINRKLGGPVVVSHTRPKLSKSASAPSVKPRPGAATKRPVPVKPRLSLQQALTEERERRSISRGPGRAISLMRSATPVVPVLKREGSEVPSLSSIPPAESQPLQANRGGVLNSKRFSQREVDMSSLVPEINTKKRKQADIEAELKEAIAALKKPNRELAGKAMVETAEKRSASASMSRKSKKLVRNPLFQGVQISATPKANRHKDMFTENQRPSLPNMTEDVDSTVLPASSSSRIPQSVARPPPEAQTRNPLFSFIQATPTRKSSHSGNEMPSMTAPNYDGCPPSSPLQPRRSSGKLFNMVPESAVKDPQNYGSSEGIQETPVKKRPEAALVHSHPEVSTPACNKENSRSRGGIDDGSKQKSGEAHEDSIYKSLGWDDADDMDDFA